MAPELPFKRPRSLVSWSLRTEGKNEATPPMPRWADGGGANDRAAVCKRSARVAAQDWRRRRRLQREAREVVGGAGRAGRHSGLYVQGTAALPPAQHAARVRSRLAPLQRREDGTGARRTLPVGR